MCDISIKTTFKQKTVYKVVYKSKRGKYYSIFAYQPIVTGPVVNNIPKMKRFCFSILTEIHSSLKIDNGLYNRKMRGKVSGFKLKSDAIHFVTDSSGYILQAQQKGKVVVLKLVLGGEILQGTTNRVGLEIDGLDINDHITYAGSVIKSFKEISS